MGQLTALAAEIHLAHQNRRLLDATHQAPLDLAMAYAVQRKLTALRMEGGAAVIGWKLGYTSTAMRRQMNIDEALLLLPWVTDGWVGRGGDRRG